ncbi:MAG: hypothetical protein JSU09_06915 [Bacteroidetes bacterium]|nr:hypothetical protein [Bacteroidota bacterium]
MKPIPILLSVGMVVTTLVTLYTLYRTFGKSKVVLLASVAWLTITAGLGLIGFYRDFATLPPRFIFLVGPPIVGVLVLFTRQGNRLKERFDMRWGTLIHIVRVPVELVLFGLMLAGYVPAIMTFEGRNFDIISGLLAIVIGLIFFKVKSQRTVLLLFNLIGLVLLVNIVGTAILSAPTPFQRIAFAQPNIGVFYFPFIWLPGFIVPAVLCCHLLSLRALWKRY